METPWGLRSLKIGLIWHTNRSLLNIQKGLFWTFKQVSFDIPRNCLGDTGGFRPPLSRRHPDHCRLFPHPRLRSCPAPISMYIGIYVYIYTDIYVYRLFPHPRLRSCLAPISMYTHTHTHRHTHIFRVINILYKYYIYIPADWSYPGVLGIYVCGCRQWPSTFIM
jgi:hypothetical protein